VHLGKQSGERFPGAGSKAVLGEPLDLAELGVEFVANDDRTELPVESADRIELLVQKGDGRAVDAPGGVEGAVALCEAVAGWIRSPWSDQIATASSVKAATTRSIVGSSTPSS
jgi:hypothetical protein